MLIFPPHEAGLSLEHNPHKNIYQTVAAYAQGLDADEWVSAAQKHKAEQTGSLWVLTWHPDTPVGSCTLAAADLDVLLKAASEGEP